MMTQGPGFDTSYRYWANCGIGSSVTTRSERGMPEGLRFLMSTVMTLRSVEPDKVKVEMWMKMQIQGGPVSFPGSETEQVLEIPASFEARPNYEEITEEQPDGGSVSVTRRSWPQPGQDPSFREGDGSLEIAGRTVPCHWIQRSIDTGGQRIHHRAWLSEHIPGGLARSESRVDGKPSEDTVTFVTAFEKK